MITGNRAGPEGNRSTEHRAALDSSPGRVEWKRGHPSPHHLSNTQTLSSPAHSFRPYLGKLVGDGGLIVSPRTLFFEGNHEEVFKEVLPSSKGGQTVLLGPFWFLSGVPQIVLERS